MRGFRQPSSPTFRKPLFPRTRHACTATMPFSQLHLSATNQGGGSAHLCENKAVAIIQQMQAGKPALIPKECEEIPIAIVLDRPLKEAQRLVENPERFSSKHCQPACWTASDIPSTIPIDNNSHTIPAMFTTVSVTVGYSWLADALIAHHHYHIHNFHHFHHRVGGWRVGFYTLLHFLSFLFSCTE